MAEPQSGGGKKRNRNKKNKNKNKIATTDGAQTNGENSSFPTEKPVPEGTQKPLDQETKPAVNTNTGIETHKNTQDNKCKAEPINEDDLLKYLLLEARYNNYMTSMAQIADAERVYYTNLQNQVRNLATPLFFEDLLIIRIDFVCKLTITVLFTYFLHFS